MILLCAFERLQSSHARVTSTETLQDSTLLDAFSTNLTLRGELEFYDLSGQSPTNRIFTCLSSGGSMVPL